LADSSDFNLEQIITDSLIETRKISSETYDFLVSLSKDRLQSRLTPAQARDIAKELIQKMGITIK
jgi:hypothetical protein